MLGNARADDGPLSGELPVIKWDCRMAGGVPHRQLPRGRLSHQEEKICADCACIEHGYVGGGRLARLWIECSPEAQTVNDTYLQLFPARLQWKADGIAGAADIYYHTL